MADREDIRSHKQINIIKGLIMKDYYEILGVERDANQADIKKQYRRLSKEHHPDKGGDGEVFAEINEAYTVLSDPTTRAAYDRGEYVPNVKDPIDRARTRLASLFDGAIARVDLEGSKHRDILQDLRDALKQTIQVVKTDIRHSNRNVKKLGEISKRVKGKDTLLNDVVENNKQRLSQHLAAQKAELEELKLIIKVCDDYEYSTASQSSGSVMGFLAAPSGDLLDMLSQKD